MNQIESGKITPERIADRWLRIKTIKNPELQPVPKIPTPGNESIGQFVSEAYDLFEEHEDLMSNTKNNNNNVPTYLLYESPISTEEKTQLIKEGRIKSVLEAADPGHLSREIKERNKNRVKEIRHKLKVMFSTPEIYKAFREDLTRQITIRQNAREVLDLDEYVERLDITTIKLAREAQVGHRQLTTVQMDLIQDHQALKKTADERRRELLQDEDVVERVRILELLKYRKELQKDGFAETPSRKKYLKKIAVYWAEGKRILLTGETGTGKTEMIKHASQMLFGVKPEVATGHQNLSIYELLGKTGFKVNEGDVFKPSPLVRAMTGRDGQGQPFLFDEIDRAPNQSIMGIKTILNVRPGEKGVQVQVDSQESFDVGPEYAVSATANIKSEKYITATELDPAIVRVFDAPMEVDYMPPDEVIDLTMASLMDRQGRLHLSGKSMPFLKTLCEAASWTQDAYQGKKITTDPKAEKFLEARAQASTGKPATLQKAVIDPGRTLDMLKGWTIAQLNEVSFEDYLNGRIIDFINNRSYPEEDRYYLVEIFALKGFLKNHDVKKFMVSGLTQSTLNRWTGAKI